MSHLHHVGHDDIAVPAHRDDVHFWEEGLCDWYHAPGKCLLLWCCMPCSLGAMRSKYLTGDYWSLDCCFDASGCLAVNHFFNQVRRDRKLRGSAVSDCLYCLFCIPCHGTRVWREIDRTVDGPHGLSGVPTPGTRDWSSGWKDCMMDKPACCLATLAYCCPYLLCLVTCLAMKREDRTDDPAACCIQHAYLRHSVRKDHGIEGNYCFDCLWACTPIAQCLDLARITRHTKDTSGVCRDRRHMEVVHEDHYVDHCGPAGGQFPSHDRDTGYTGVYSANLDNQGTNSNYYTSSSAAHRL